jgi:two-component system response regulator CpxR
MNSVSRAPVLIVEDDADIRELLSSVLALEGYPVVTAADGAEGLEQLRAAHPALVLLDLMMPSMDGWEFRRLQMMDPTLAEVPTVILSGDGRLEAKAASLGTAFLRKPVDLDELLSVVAKASA